MIKKLSDEQLLILTTALEESNWGEVLKSYNFNAKDKNKWRNFNLKIYDVRKKDSFLVIDDIFEKIGWCAEPTHHVFTIRKLSDWLVNAKVSLRVKIREWQIGLRKSLKNFRQ